VRVVGAVHVSVALPVAIDVTVRFTASVAVSEPSDTVIVSWPSRLSPHRHLVTSSRRHLVSTAVSPMPTPRTAP
jgi:hypothetical protein